MANTIVVNAVLRDDGSLGVQVRIDDGEFIDVPMENVGLPRAFIGKVQRAEKKFYCSQGDFTSDAAGKCPNHGYKLHEKGKVLLLDDNPISIASYLEEYGDDL